MEIKLLFNLFFKYLILLVLMPLFSLVKIIVVLLSYINILI